MRWSTSRRSLRMKCLEVCDVTPRSDSRIRIVGYALIKPAGRATSQGAGVVGKLGPLGKSVAEGTRRKRASCRRLAKTGFRWPYRDQRT
jgi:hypothetical protein